MSLYSSIDRRINADAWFRGLSHDAQLLWFRLLTGSHVTPIPGLWAATEEGLAKAFGFTLERFRELFAELSREPASNGLPRVISDWSAGVIWLPNSLKHPCNQPANENVIKGWISHLDLVPECPLKDQAIHEFKRWVERYPKRFKAGWPNGLPNGSALVSPQEQEQEQEQKKPPEAPATAAPAKPSSARFAMHAQWRPSDETIASLETGLVPRFAIEKLIPAHRTHFCAIKQDKRSESEWNQSFSKWVTREWNNPKTRPRPEPVADVQAAEGWES